MLLLAGLLPRLGAGEVADGLDDVALQGVVLAGGFAAVGVRRQQRERSCQRSVLYVLGLAVVVVRHDDGREKRFEETRKTVGCCESVNEECWGPTAKKRTLIYGERRRRRAHAPMTDGRAIKETHDVTRQIGQEI